MNLTSIAAIITITLALIFYTIGVWDVHGFYRHISYYLACSLYVRNGYRNEKRVRKVLKTWDI